MVKNVHETKNTGWVLVILSALSALAYFLSSYAVPAHIAFLIDRSMKVLEKLGLL